MKSITRRKFLSQTGIATGAVFLSTKSWSQVKGANSDIRVGVIGFNGRGESHISAFTKMQGVRLMALCDADKSVLERGASKVKEQNPDLKSYNDMRDMFKDKDIDAVSIATPNHWHSLAAIWACQAGKDVYVEKPISHNVWEGRKVVEAARKYKRIVQTGTQSRSEHALRDAFAWVREGNLGKIKVARGLCYKRRPSIGKVDGPQPIPPNIDYNLWCGPAPMEPLMRKNLHYDWHWVWPTGNGDLGNQGIHQMDLVRWCLGKNELSPRILSVGGRFGYIDDGQTPNTMFVVHDYGDAMIIFEVRGLPARTDAKAMDEYKHQSVGHVIECEGGYLAGKIAYDKDGKEIKKFSGGENHFENFIKGVRSRRPEDLNAEILEGHLSSALCHTGNISYRLGHLEKPEEVTEHLNSNPAALETFDRMQQHLGANGVDLAQTNPRMGVFLEMNPKTERFTNNDKANEMLTRNYRAPFIVPEKV
jgi:predicted dehydrogenase